MSFSDVVIGPPLVVGFALRPNRRCYSRRPPSATNSKQPAKPLRGELRRGHGSGATRRPPAWCPEHRRSHPGKAAPVPQHERLVSPLSGASIRSSGLSLGCSVMADHGGRPGRFSRRTLLSAVGAALVSADLAATARAGVLVDQRFDRMRDRNGWG